MRLFEKKEPQLLVRVAIIDGKAVVLSELD